MSEYEKINASVKAQMAARRKAAIKRIILVFVVVITILASFVGLEAIGFISFTFMVILSSITICTGAFKAGYIWRDVKW